MSADAIVNPSRLNAERQIEVCMQCHLETTSTRLPNSIQRYERGAFSYKPGEPLGGFHAVLRSCARAMAVTINSKS